MARYIDKDKAIALLRNDCAVSYPDTYRAGIIASSNEIATMPVENVASRTETNDLEYKLIGVMHSVDKWLEGDELNQDEVNRAATMREKTLKIVEALEDERDRYKKYFFRHEYDKWEAEIKQEVARQMFEELIEALQGEIEAEDKQSRNAWEQSDIEGYHIHEYAEDKLDTFKIALSLYKKKYIGE